MTRCVPFVLMRGGTSKGVFLRAQDVPAERAALVPFLLDVFGSPDRRQIDGLGGADKLTSKAAIIGPPVRADADLAYLFGQVGILAPEVDFNLNCGNLTAAVGAYAIEEGLVTPVEGHTAVRIHNVNTDRIITAHVPVRDGRPVVEGDLAIAGVPGTGAPIALDFARTAGALTGRILPLGAPVSRLAVEGLGEIEVSVVDAANLLVFVHAASLGMAGTEGPLEIDADAALCARLNGVRRAVAHAVGLGDYFDARANPSTPLCAVVSASAPYRTFNGGEVAAGDSDFVIRLFASGSTHRALAATASACTAVAARIPGTLPHALLAEEAHRRAALRFGHPSGVIPVEAAVATGSGDPVIRTVRILRTARRIAEGRVFLRNPFETGEEP